MGALALLGALAAAGCRGTGLGGSTPPEVSLVNVAVVEVTPFETSLALTLRCSNANPEPLTTTGAVHTVTLNGVRAGRALSDRAFEVPRLGEATETVTLRIDNLLLLTRLRGLLTGRSLEYGLDSRIFVATERGERSLQSERSGLIDLPESWTEGFDPLRALPAFRQYAPERERPSGSRE